MTTSLQYFQAGDGTELRAPDATLTIKVDGDHTGGEYELFEVDAPRQDPTPLHRTGWAKTYYVLQGRILVQVEAEGFDLGPGASIAIPPGALHTFTVLTPTTTFLVFSLTSAMGRFHADLDASLGPGHSPDEALSAILKVVERHDVAISDGQVVR